MLKLGSRVRFVNDKLEGVITKLEGKIAGVTTADGFEIPVSVNELVHIPEPHIQIPHPKKSHGPTSGLVKVHDGMHLAFERISDAKLDLKLHNSASDIVLYAVYIYDATNKRHVLHGELAFEQHVSLSQIELEQVGNIKAIECDFIYVSLDEDSPMKKPEKLTLHLTGKRFHQSFGYCYFLNKQAYYFPLTSQATPIELAKLKQHSFDSKSENVNTVNTYINRKSNTVIDLHAEQLSTNAKNLPAADILAMQLKAASDFIDQSHIAGLSQVIIIHGVGNAFLKKKIHDMLKRNPLVQSHQPADYLNYGGGATQVSLKVA